MEEAGVVSSLGTSILVPCVQELAKCSPTSIPPRYLRPEQDLPLSSTSVTTPPSHGIPIIDFNCLLSGDGMELELEKLHHAFKEWGFFQLRNHGVSSGLVEEVKVAIQGFFNLPMEEKKKFWQRPGQIEGFGQAFVVSEEQKLDWADLFFMVTLPPHLRKPHLFPNLPLPFRDILEVYAVELRNLTMKILGFIAKALKMEDEDMKAFFEDGYQAMRMNYYPPCPQPDKVIGLTPHSDSVGLTILLQVNEMEGLQIRKDGAWIPIKPLPEAFIVNIGDILEIVTNGNYRSVEHRAVVNSVKERLSVATFFNPKLEGNVGPAPSLVTPHSPAIFKTVSNAEYLKGLFSRELQGRGYLDALRIDREAEES